MNFKMAPISRLLEKLSGAASAEISVQVHWRAREQISPGIGGKLKDVIFFFFFLSVKACCLFLEKKC